MKSSNSIIKNGRIGCFKFLTGKSQKLLPNKLLRISFNIVTGIDSRIFE